MAVTHLALQQFREGKIARAGDGTMAGGVWHGMEMINDGGASNQN